MNKTTNWLLAAALIIAAFVLGWAFKMPVSALKQYDRTVSVRGLATKEVKADYAIAPFAYSLLGNDMQSLYQEIKRKNEIFIDFIKSYGIPSEEISVSTPQFTDRRTWDNNSGYAFQVTSVITVGTKNVDAVIRMMTEQSRLMEKNIVPLTGWEYRPTYSFRGLNDIKPEMIEEATKNAREAAMKFAADSDSKLGKIKNATQGQFSIDDRDENTPYIKNVRIVTYVDFYLKD